MPEKQEETGVGESDRWRVDLIGSPLLRRNEAQARQFTASLLGISIDSDAHWFKGPEQRIDHEQIRAHPLLAPLGLPRFTAGREEASSAWPQSLRIGEWRTVTFEII